MGKVAIMEEDDVAFTAEFVPGEPDESPQMDLFEGENKFFPIKNDQGSMELPIFSLSKKIDMEVLEVQIGDIMLRVIPSAYGRATVPDYDLLVCIATQIRARLNEGKPVGRKWTIKVNKFLKTVNREAGGKSYQGIQGMLRRLKGTIVETTYTTGGEKGESNKVNGFGIINDYQIISQSSKNDSILEFSVELSNWFYNAFTNDSDVLTVTDEYYSLPPLHKRIYQIGKKHMGKQGLFVIKIDNLITKVGTRTETNAKAKFRARLREIIAEDCLPEMRIGIENPGSRSGDEYIIFMDRDRVRLSKALISKGTAFMKRFETIEKKSADLPTPLEQA